MSLLACTAAEGVIAESCWLLAVTAAKNICASHAIATQAGSNIVWVAHNDMQDVYSPYTGEPCLKAHALCRQQRLSCGRPGQCMWHIPNTCIVKAPRMTEAVWHRLLRPHTQEQRGRPVKGQRTDPVWSGSLPVHQCQELGAQQWALLLHSIPDWLQAMNSCLVSSKQP